MSRTPNTRRSKDNRPARTIDLSAEKPKPSAPEAVEPVVPDAEPVAFDQLAAADPGPAVASSEPIDDVKTTTGSDDGGGPRHDNDHREAAGAREPDQLRPAGAESTVPRRSGGLSAISGGLIGGVAALAIAGALQWMGVLGVPGGGNTTSAFDPAPLQAEIAALREQLDSRPADAAGVPPGEMAELRDATLKASEAAAGSATQLAELAGRIEALAAETDSLRSSLASGAGGEAPALAALAERADAIEQRLAALPDAGGAASEEVKALGDRVAAVEQAVGGLQALDGAVAEVRGAVEPLVSLPSRVDELQSAIATLAARVDEVAAQVESSASGEQVARAIAASGLNAAINRGGPFMTELEAYATVAPDAPEIESLKAHAAAGVPTLAALTDRFPAVANDIIASQPADAGGGVFDRLMTSAQSLVKVRPVGEVEGDTPGAITARMEVALKRGDVDAALAEWEKLPDHAKAASEAFIADLRARRDVDQLAEKALKNAMAANDQG